MLYCILFLLQFNLSNKFNESINGIINYEFVRSSQAEFGTLSLLFGQITAFTVTNLRLVYFGAKITSIHQ